MRIDTFTPRVPRTYLLLIAALVWTFAGGMLLFSTEMLEVSEQDYRLNISGRYSHHPDYLARILNGIGFKILKTSNVAIRTESGCPIDGQFICASRSK